MLHNAGKQNKAYGLDKFQGWVDMEIKSGQFLDYEYTVLLNNMTDNHVLDWPYTQPFSAESLVLPRWLR